MAKDVSEPSKRPTVRKSTCGTVRERHTERGAVCVSNAAMARLNLSDEFRRNATHTHTRTHTDSASKAEAHAKSPLFERHQSRPHPLRHVP